MGFILSAVSGRSMVKFEGGYTVDTVFDGSKLGIEPHSIEVSPSGDLLVLDSENSNIYKISTPLSKCKLGLGSTLLILFTFPTGQILVPYWLVCFGLCCKTSELY